MLKHYVLFVHGMDELKPNERFSDSLQKNLKKVVIETVPDNLWEPAKQGIDMEEGNWSVKIQPDQDLLWKRLFSKMNWLDRTRHLTKLRNFIVHYLGDPIAYVEKPGDNRSGDFHACVRDVIKKFHQDAIGKGATPQKPALLTIVAHSLGSVITSDLIYDLQQKNPAWPFPELALANFFSMGSPLPLYVLRYRYSEKFTAGTPVFERPIQMTDPSGYGLWINIYDPQDILGYPLKPLNKEYEKAVFTDKMINAGAWWNPLSATPFNHDLYWADDTVAKIVGRKVALDWLRENQPRLDLQQKYADYRSWVAP